MFITNPVSFMFITNPVSFGTKLPQLLFLGLFCISQFFYRIKQSFQELTDTEFSNPIVKLKSMENKKTDELQYNYGYNYTVALPCLSVHNIMSDVFKAVGVFDMILIRFLAH